MANVASGEHKEKEFYQVKKMSLDNQRQFPPLLQHVVPAWEVGRRVVTDVQIPESWGTQTMADLHTFETDDDDFFSPFAFRREASLGRRRKLFKSIQQTYPDRIPIIVALVGGGQSVTLDKERFLAPFDMTYGAFIQQLRQSHLAGSVAPNLALALFTETTKVSPAITTQMEQVWLAHRNVDDYFLYLLLTLENTFGCVTMRAGKIFE